METWGELALDAQTAAAKLLGQHNLVHRLQQARTERFVHFERSVNNNFAISFSVMTPPFASLAPLRETKGSGRRFLRRLSIESSPEPTRAFLLSIG
jgi:hypothetical protein